MNEEVPKSNRLSSSWSAIAFTAVSLLVYLMLLLYHIAPYDYNVSSLIRIGSANPFFNESLLGPGLVVFDDPASGGDGYDGQFFYYTIKQLFMGAEGRPNPFRFQRILYPAASFIVAFGRSELLPVSMLIVSLFSIVISALLLWRMISDSPISSACVLVYTLNIGYLIAVFYNVATPLCIGMIVAAAYFYSHENFWRAAAAMALALLAQEISSIALVALCSWLVLKRNWRGSIVLATAVVPWFVWQVILWRLYGNFVPLMSGNHFRPPFVGMISQISAFHLPGGWAANLRELSVYPFMAFVVLVLLVSLIELRKRPTDFAFVLLIHALVGICFNREQIWSSAITSPARTLAGIFPFLVLCYARHRSGWIRGLIIASVILSIMGIARILLMPPHPFYITQ